jgi:putative Ca2+/H+ antiporter (TMEM165/GDT1 family)
LPKSATRRSCSRSCWRRGSLLDGAWFRYIVALSFIAMAGWTLIPDKFDQEDHKPARFGAFATTLVAFFLVEMGDKTQLATIALGARFHSVLPVMTGTTLGMLIANVPAVLLGHELIKRVPLKTVRLIAALLFLAIGAWLLVQTMGL